MHLRQFVNKLRRGLFTAKKTPRHREYSAQPQFVTPGLETLERRIVLSPISDKYAQLGGANGLLGAALTCELPVIEQATGIQTGFYQDFANGSIYYSPISGAHEIDGPIRDIWLGKGGAQRDVPGSLGYPVTDVSVLVALA
jgi:hypothetical protein